MSPALREEIEGLAELAVPELKAKYAEAFGERSRSGNAAFLRKRVAWRLQARAMGGLSERARRRAEEIADEADVRVRPPRPSRRRPSASQNPCDRTQASNAERDPRLPPPGELLVREFRGMSVAVRVLEDGFEYGGRRYTSLSPIACEVTGSRWNGFRFFKLK